MKSHELARAARITPAHLRRVTNHGAGWFLARRLAALTGQPLTSYLHGRSDAQGRRRRTRQAGGARKDHR